MNFSCQSCQSRIIDQEYFDHFGVKVCFNCKESNILFEILTKTQARNEYLLTDEELADSALLPSMSRRNPHNPRWADMKLYLRCQICDFAVKKYGSLEAIKEAIANKNEIRTDRKSKQFLKKLKELRSKTKVEKNIDFGGKKGHIHLFSSGGCTICGLKVLQEEI